MFETCIFGSPVELITDHNPLNCITKNALQSSKLQQSAPELQKYNITVSYCPGARLTNADALSRLETTEGTVKHHKICDQFSDSHRGHLNIKFFFFSRQLLLLYSRFNVIGYVICISFCFIAFSIVHYEVLIAFCISK